MKVYLYRMVVDGGTAPNVEGGVCSLAICKPTVRRVAKEGDYIVGLRARSGPLGALGPDAVVSVLYVMKVTMTLPMNKYEEWCRGNCPSKIPSPENYLGDSMYDAMLNQNPYGPHGPEWKERDLRGENVLLAVGAENFWYRRHSTPAGHPLREDLARKWEVEKVKRGHHTKNLDADTERQLLEWLSTFPRDEELVAPPPARVCGGGSRSHVYDSDDDA